MTPGRYVGAEEVEDDGEPFEEKLRPRPGEFELQSGVRADFDSLRNSDIVANRVTLRGSEARFAEDGCLHENGGLWSYWFRKPGSLRWFNSWFDGRGCIMAASKFRVKSHNQRRSQGVTRDGWKSTIIIGAEILAREQEGEADVAIDIANDQRLSAGVS